MFQPAQTPTLSNAAVESFAIKRRHMTFAEAERARNHRTVQLALLNVGDMIGLESYVFDLSTHLNSARCTAPCDLFYILKHNFVRLQKRHGTQGLAERLRETVSLSFHAYPPKILSLPLFDSLIKRYLSANSGEEHTQHQKQTWRLHQATAKNSVRSQMILIRSCI